MAKADGGSVVRSRRDGVPMPARLTPGRHRRIDSALKRSIESANLIEAVETERSRLMKAQAILNCTLVAMDCDDHAGAPYYPDALQVVQELLNQSIDRLDSLRLRPMIQALGGAEPARSEEEMPQLDPRSENELRDGENVIYM